MFEQRKSITVKGVTFNMVLVEGDKFCIGEEEHEVDDFYMAEIPVTQELYMAVMGPAHSGSHNMMPDNFDYLDLDRFSIYGNVINHNESIEDYQKRIDKQWKDKRDREDAERARIVKLSASLPVNNVSWLEALDFIKRLNELTGLNFGMPSFEQWYFAAIGGIESKGYAFAGSDDANAVGHFHKLSTIVQSQGLFVMDDKSNKSKKRHEAKDWYIKPGSYLPNELGLYDMSGLVYEWLDEAGKVIGGSFNSNPDGVSKQKLFGYTSISNIDSCSHKAIIMPILKSAYEYSNNPGDLIGVRLVLLKEPKHYFIPKKPSTIIEYSKSENHFLNLVNSQSDFGVLRSNLSYKFIKHLKDFNREVYTKIHGSVYNIFMCPQNLYGFNGRCFETFHSKREFKQFCKNKFQQLLTLLVNTGYNLLILDRLDLRLHESGIFSMLNFNSKDYVFKTRKDRNCVDLLTSNILVTNNPDIVQVNECHSLSGKVFHKLSFPSNLVFIEIRDTFTVENNKELVRGIDTIDFPTCIEGNDALRISLNCFCDFKSIEKASKPHIVTTIYDKMSQLHGRINCVNVDDSMKDKFIVKNKGGQYEYHFPSSDGEYLILDENFYILPQSVYNELSQSLKK